MGTCDALLCMFHTLQSALESRYEARIVQINFSPTFDSVNHQGILYHLSSICLIFGKQKVMSLLFQVAFQCIIYYHRMWGKLSTTCSNAKSSPIGAPSCIRPQATTDNGVRDGRSNLLVTGQYPMSSTYCTLQMWATNHETCCSH